MSARTTSRPGWLRHLAVEVKPVLLPWFDERAARTQRRPKLPSVLSAEEITRILDHATNLKHWTIIATFYATGLRCTVLGC
jgi:integrase